MLVTDYLKTTTYQYRFRQCRKCYFTKPLRNFAKDKKQATGYGHICKICRNIDRRENNRLERIRQHERTNCFI